MTPVKLRNFNLAYWFSRTNVSRPRSVRKLGFLAAKAETAVKAIASSIRNNK